MIDSFFSKVPGLHSAILPEKEVISEHSLNKNEVFPLRISSINVTKSAVSCGFGHVHGRNPERKNLKKSEEILNGKLHFLGSDFL